jgi:hypothetical protein
MDECVKKYTCNLCNKNYSSKSSICNHNKKFHKKISENLEKISENIGKPNVPNQTCIETSKSYNCRKCNKYYNNIQSRWSHEKICKETIEYFETQINKLKVKLKNENIKTPLNYPINNQLINIIVNKTNTIEELQLKMNNVENTVSDNLIESNKIPTTLNLNNVIIVSRDKDNYINATQLCQAGNKQFNDWFRLNTTNQLINEVTCETGIPVSQLVDIKKGNSNEFIQGSWIHPDLAIQLAQWISPKFALQVSRWIRTLFTNGNISIDVKILEDKNKEIKLKDHKIQLLQDAFVKKQQRQNYPEKNVIYMLTTEDNKKKRNYTLGKTTNLKNRLGNYNKSNEHEVVYYKECNNEEDMNVIELMILNKLKKYKEKANRDRFILPLEKDITFFTNIIDNCINFF